MYVPYLSLTHNRFLFMVNSIIRNVYDLEFYTWCSQFSKNALPFFHLIFIVVVNQCGHMNWYHGTLQVVALQSTEYSKRFKQNLTFLLSLRPKESATYSILAKELPARLMQLELMLSSASATTLSYSPAISEFISPRSIDQQLLSLTIQNRVPLKYIQALVCLSVYELTRQMLLLQV